MNTISIFRYRFRVIALNDAGPSEAGEPSEPVVIDVPGVQIAPYFVHTLNDTMALENDTVCYWTSLFQMQLFSRIEMAISQLWTHATLKYFLFQIEFRVAVLGTPKPSVQWYKDEVEIFSCERLEVKEEDEGGAVILKGEY